MSRQQIMDLRPGTNYQIQVRSVADDAVSEWSRVFSFTTLVDTVLPKTPQNATWVASGDSFHGEWDVVTQNTSAETINVDHYDVELVNGATTRIVTVAQGSARMSYDLSYEANRALFTTPKAAITMRVRAVDSKGLAGDWTLPITATNAAPAAPTGLTVNAVTDGVYLKWTAPADTDLAGYNLYVGSGPGPTVKVNNKPIASTEYNYQTTTYTLQYFKITAVDKFGAESTGIEVSATPVSPFASDTTAPSTPTALAATITNNANGIGATAAVSWTMSSPPSDLAGFWVRYRKVGDTFYTNLTFQSADRNGTVVLPAAYTNYEFQIKAFDWANNESAWSSTVTATSPGAGTPTTISALTITPLPSGLRFAWSAVPETNIKYYEVQIATNSGMSTGVQTFNTGQALFLNVNGLAQNTQYWAQVRAVNLGGTAGAWGPVSPATATTQKFLDVITVTADVIQPGTLGAGIIDIGAGATLRTNGGAIKSNTFNGTFTSGTYNNDATAGFYIDNNNIIIPQGKISASALIAGTISGTNNIVLSGANAKITGGSWELSGNGLSIPDGGIQAAKLVIQSGQNIVPGIYSDFEANQAIYSNSNSSYINIQQGGIIVGTNPSFKFGTQSFGTIWGTNTVNPIIAFATSPTDYPIPVEGGKTYIFSLYTWCQGSVPTNVQMKVKWGNGTQATLSTGAGYSTSANLPSGMPFDASTAVRLSGYATVPAGVTGCQIQIESSTLTSGAGYNIDGVMVEEKISSAYAPSAWKPGTTTTIMGDQIRTGQIISNNTGLLTAVIPVYDTNAVQTGTQNVVIPDPNNAPAWKINTQGDAVFSNLNIAGNAVVGPSTASGTYPINVVINTTSGSPNATAAEGQIVLDDMGQPITSANLPAGTTVKYVIQDNEYAIRGNMDDDNIFPFNNAGQTSRYFPDGAIAHSGATSLKAVSGASATSIPLSYGAIPVSTGDVINISYWVYRDSTYNGTNANAKLRMGDQSSAIISAGTTFYDAASTAANTWVQKSVSYTVTAGVTALNMTLSVDHTAGNIWFDDFSIVNATRAVSTNGTADIVFSANATATGTAVAATLSRKVDYTSSVSSSNYMPGSTGWTIRSDGYAEFRNVAADSIRVDALSGGQFTNGDIELKGVYNNNGDLVKAGRLIAKGSAGWVYMDNTGFYSMGWADGQDPNSGAEPQKPYIQFPNTGAPNIVSGKLISEELIVNGNSAGVGASLNKNNFINTSSTLTLLGSIQTPSAPLATVSWPNVPTVLYGGTNASYQYTGIAYSSTGNTSYLIREHPQVNYQSAGTTNYTKKSYWRVYQQSNNNSSAGALSGDTFIGTIQSASGTWTDGATITYGSGFTWTNFMIDYARNNSTTQGVVLYSVDKWSESINGTTGAYSSSNVRANGLYARIFNASSGAYVAGGSENWYSDSGQPPVTAGAENGRLMAYPSNVTSASVGVDYINNRFLVGYLNSSGNLLIGYLNVSGSTVTLVNLLTIAKATIGNSTDISVVGFGTFDFGANRYVLRDGTRKKFIVFDSAGVEQTAYAWPYATGIVSTDFGSHYSAWDPSNQRFKQINKGGPGNYRQYEYAANTNNTGTTFNSGALTQPWIFKTTLFDSNGDSSLGIANYETPASPASATQTVSNRSQVTVTLPSAIPYNATIPASPNQARVWVSKNGAAYTLAATINQPATTYILTGASQPGTALPGSPANAFPSGDAAYIQSSAPGVTLKGDGSWSLGDFTSSNSGVTNNYSIKIGGVRILIDAVSTPATTGTVWTGTATFPAGSFSGTPRIVISGASDGSPGIVWNAYSVTSSGFSWRAAWNDISNHSNGGTAYYLAIGPA